MGTPYAINVTACHGMFQKLHYAGLCFRLVAYKYFVVHAKVKAAVDAIGCKSVSAFNQKDSPKP